jgi:hypothetical protein
MVKVVRGRSGASGQGGEEVRGGEGVQKIANKIIKNCGRHGMNARFVQGTRNAKGVGDVWWLQEVQGERGIRNKAKMRKLLTWLR